MKNKCIPFLFFLLFLLACSGCDSEKSGLRELKKLCEKDAGLAINKTVEADGYYDSSQKGGALRTLISSRFEFIEFCNYEPNITSLFDGPGCWRLTKALRVTGRCDARVDKALNRSGGYSYPEFREDNCIEAEKIKKPLARYSYHSEPKAWLDKNGKSEFRRSNSYIKETLSGQVIGRYVSYSYNVRPRHSSPKSCHTIDDRYISYAQAKLIESVIGLKN